MRYFLLTHYRKPDGKIDESVTVSNKIKMYDNQTCNVILDFKELKVVKCVVDGAALPRDWEKIMTYYYQYYQATIDRLLKENGYELVKEETQPEPTDPS
jgi:hypothetical protein